MVQQQQQQQQAMVVSVNGRWVAYAHTFFAGSAFLGALVVGCWLHYIKIVTNEFFTYPQEWCVRGCEDGCADRLGFPACRLPLATGILNGPCFKSSLQ